MNEYATETHFYRKVLGIAYETGKDLLKRGILIPDAIADPQGDEEGRPLFSLATADLERHRYRIRYYWMGKARRNKTDLEIQMLR